MKGSSTVNSAVRKASKASKRKGKWATQPEIKAKILKTLKFKESILPILKYLVKQNKIEKKKNVAMWRPTGLGLAALGGIAATTAMVRVGSTVGNRMTSLFF
jgi:hypothetical protein